MSNVDRQIGLSGGWLAGPSAGLAMTAGSDYLQNSPTLRTVCFFLGIAGFAISIAHMVWVHASERKEHRTLNVASVLMIIGALVFMAGACWRFWPLTRNEGGEQRLARADPALGANIVEKGLLLKDMQVSGPYPGTDTIIAIGFFSGYFDKVRIVISVAQDGEPSSRVLHCGNILDTVKDDQMKHPILRYDARNSLYFWCDSEDAPLPAGITHVRVQALGPNKIVQSYTFQIYLARSDFQVPGINQSGSMFLIKNDESFPWDK